MGAHGSSAVRPISHWSSVGSLPSSRFRELIGGGFNHTLELACKLRKCLALELSHPLARDSELMCDRVERLLLPHEAEAKLEESLLALGQGGKG